MAAPLIEIPHTVRRSNGQAVSGVSVQVNARGGAAATLYSNAAGAAGSNPTTSDANGQLSAYAAPGRYDLVFTVDGVARTVEWDASSGALEAWATPAYLGTWVSFDAATYAPARYRKTSEGIVIIQGLVKLGTIGTAVFNLPAGYRPSKRLIFPAISNGAIGRLDILTTGDVTPFAGNNTYFALDGITFPAEA